MPHDEGLPQTGEAQEIGQDAIDCLRANRPKGWRLTELAGDNDFGFDFQVQLAAEQQVVHPFRLQLKGTRSPKRSVDGAYFSIPLSTSTLRYFDNTDEPVLLVLCDLSVDPEEPRNGVLYYVWVREELERIDIGSVPLEQKEAVLHVPAINVLNRATDLLDEVRKRHRLSKVGHALEISVAEMDPAMVAEDRVVMVEAITKNIGSRNIVFAQALAESATDIWVNPPRGSLAWLLMESKSAIDSGKVGRCHDLLQRVAEKLPGATTLERAEYWYLTGRMHLVQGDDSAASLAFWNAVDAEQLAKYWAAWAESELRRRYRLDGSADFSDVLSALPEKPDSMLLGIKVRLFAASRRYEEAMALLETFEGPESLVARAVVQTMYSKHEEALQACIDGIAQEDKARESTRLLFLILRARARFSIALRGAEFSDGQDDTEGQILPPSGPRGVDAAALRCAWTDIEEAVVAVEEIRWVSNAEFVADIWVSTAAMLGKQEQILGRLLAAARARPDQPELQAAAESIAAQCGDFEAALEANDRLPEGNMKFLRRILFLHELDKHRDCVDLMMAHVDGTIRCHQFFASSMVAAIISADILAKTDLVQTWRAMLLDGAPEHQAQAAVLDYLLARKKNRLGGDDVLAELARADERLGHPNSTTLLLFQELDPGESSQAEQFLAVAERLRAASRLSPVIAVRIGVALAALERWDDLLSLCEEAEREFDLPRRIKAFHAFALDQLGRSDEARAILEGMLESGIDDGLALNTYVNIMVRWGITEKARAAAELILERAQTRERRMECVQLLFNLEQRADHASSRLIDLAFRMGELVAQDDEVEEGRFLGMVLATTSLGTAALSDAQREELQKRMNSFFERFPQSKVIRRMEYSEEAGAEELMRSMKSAIGLTDEREQARARLEAQLRSGALPIPFAWRPRFALGNVHDVAHLWELSKRSTIEDTQFHLNMSGQSWSPRPAVDFQSKTPLFDLITLFVLKDLDLIDLAFEFFQKVAIGQETLAELTRMAQIFSGSILREKCVELQAVLRPHLAKILQPQGNSSDGDERFPRSSCEIKTLVGSDSFVLYSDDAIFRKWALDERFDSVGMCTLDLLCALEETGRLSSTQVGEMLAKLCDWHVGVHIQLRHQIALICDEVRVATSVSEGVALLAANPRFMSIANGIWGPHSDFEVNLTHIGSATRELVQDPLVSDIAIGSFIGIWFDKVKQRLDVSIPALDLAAQVVLHSIAPNKLPIAAARRLWGVYFEVVRSLGGCTDSKSATLAIERVAVLASSLDVQVRKDSVGLSSTVGERLMMGLDIKSNACAVFCRAYVNKL
ncbi:DUF4365 domain-containing protein [Burkholderia arboris]|uniref:DUF4365 domain-containing protein n=1 Tax=Burkholderia arboris TaxID=488730 RepID=UPI001CA43D52|nr:DUF4365 domain-containing protein [Burkholderia arboris]MBY8604160.1 DUF4365 domain-containing protein [Burkholderia arboris]